MMGVSVNPPKPANILSNFSFKKKNFVIIALVLIMAICLSVGYVLAHRDINIVDKGKTYHVKVVGGNVEKAIREAGLKLSKDDLTEPSLGTNLKQGMKIKILRAFPVKLLVDGKVMEVKTPYQNVSEILKSKRIKLSQLDKVEPGKDAKVNTGATIKVIRVVVKTETNKEEIAYNIEKRNDNNMQKGQTKVLQEGQKGLADVTVKLVYEDGKEVSREVLAKKVINKPVDAIVAAGTANYIVASRGESIKYSKSLRLYATAYSHTGSNTATGIYPYRGVVAVDPSVIPLGTRLYITGYGYAVALDKGSAIKGNKIDLFFDTEGEAYGFNNRYVDVYILE